MTPAKTLTLFYMPSHQLVLFALLSETRLSRKRSLILSGLFGLLLTTANEFIRINSGSFYLTLAVFTFMLPNLIYCFLISKYRDGRFFLTFSLVAGLYTEIISFSNYIEEMWSFGSYETMLVIRFLSWPLLEWAAVKWVSKPYISAQRQLNMKWTLPAVTGWLFYITLYLMWSIPHVIILDTPAYLAALLLIMILMPLMYVVIFSSLIRQWKLNQSQQKELLLQTEMELLRSRIEQTSYTERQLSIQRHDLRHRFQALNTMIERGEYDAALNYIADSTHSLSETEIPHFCSESVLDAVFASYFHIAASKGIRINSELELPRELPHYLQTIRINISFPFFPYIY